MKHSLVLSLVSLYNMHAQHESGDLEKLARSPEPSDEQISYYIKKSDSLFQDIEYKKFQHYLQFISRSFVIQLYELCKNTAHFSSFKNQDWFVFLANLRHAFAHGVHGNWRITYYGKKHITYTRQNDLQTFTLNPYRDNSPIKAEQYGGLLTIWDLVHYVEQFVFSK